MSGPGRRSSFADNRRPLAVGVEGENPIVNSVGGAAGRASRSVVEPRAETPNLEIAAVDAPTSDLERSPRGVLAALRRSRVA